MLNRQLMPALVLAAASPVLAQDLEVAFRNGVNLATTTTDQHGQAFTVVGLSGIVRISGDFYIAVMDNSNTLVFLTISLAADGSINSAVITSGFALSESRDFEDIALTGHNSVLLAEEGTPSICEYSLTDGALLQQLPTPPVFLTRRDNFGFESLSRSASGAALWTANEEALSADGPLSTQSIGTTIRLVRYEAAGGSYAPGAQFAYQCQPLHGAAITGSRSGVSQLLILPGGRLISLERSFAFGATFFQTRIYEVTTAGATDVRSFPTLSSGGYTPASKRLLYSGNLNNLEGLALGPQLPNGHWALIGIVDDGDPISVNRVNSFELSGPVGGPACSSDFNCDGDIGTDSDIEAFFACLAGTCCANCGSADFNADGDIGTDADIESFFRVLGGGSC